MDEQIVHHRRLTISNQRTLSVIKEVASAWNDSPARTLDRLVERARLGMIQSGELKPAQTASEGKE